MPATLAPTARPPYALTIWSDDRSIFVEIPSAIPSLPAYIAAYPLTEGGLGKVLHLMRKAYADAKPASPANYTRQPAVRKFGPAIQATDAQRETARALLRKVGAI